MAEGMSFSFPSLLFHEGRTYGQPEVVPISLPQVSTGLRSRLPGSFRRRGFQPDLLMPQEALFAREAHSMQAAMLYYYPHYDVCNHIPKAIPNKAVYGRFRK